MTKKKKLKKIVHELKEHYPFTFLATLIAVLLVFLIKVYLKKDINESVFHILHPAHLFVSAIVTSALFFKYKRKPMLTLIIGLTGSIIIGSLSDIIFPWLGGLAFNLKPSFHLPLIETPFLIISTALIGSLIGIATKFTKIPHFIHVFLSVFASLFYLIAFSQVSNTIGYVVSTLIVFIAVLVPCCISDILFPMFFVKKD